MDTVEKAHHYCMASNGVLFQLLECISWHSGQRYSVYVADDPNERFTVNEDKHLSDKPFRYGYSFYDTFDQAAEAARERAIENAKGN